MDETSALRHLPESYAFALRLRAQGFDDAEIATQLDLEPEAVGPLLRIAEAKLAALIHGEGPGEIAHQARSEGKTR